jgi:hypothetical protein
MAPGYEWDTPREELRQVIPTPMNGKEARTNKLLTEATAYIKDLKAENGDLHQRLDSHMARHERLLQILEERQDVSSNSSVLTHHCLADLTLVLNAM